MMSREKAAAGVAFSIQGSEGGAKPCWERRGEVRPAAFGPRAQSGARYARRRETHAGACDTRGKGRPVETQGAGRLMTSHDKT